MLRKLTILTVFAAVATFASNTDAKAESRSRGRSRSSYAKRGYDGPSFVQAPNRYIAPALSRRGYLSYRNRSRLNALRKALPSAGLIASQAGSIYKRDLWGLTYGIMTSPTVIGPEPSPPYTPYQFPRSSPLPSPPNVLNDYLNRSGHTSGGAGGSAYQGYNEDAPRGR